MKTRQEIVITGAFYTEWFARQKQISGKTLADVLGYGYDFTKQDKTEDEIGAAAMMWAGGDAEPLDLSDMDVETYDDGT